MKVCPGCNGNGVQVITAQTLTSKGWSTEPPLEITCITCNGAKVISPAKESELAAFAAMWCQCGNPSGEVSFYRRESGAHGYTCCDCGKVVQTG